MMGLPPDTSTPADRAAFCRLVEGGGAGLRTAASAVEFCTAKLPDTVAALLDLDGGTYAQAVFRLRSSWGDGRAGH